MTVNQQRPDGIEVIAPLVRQPDDQIEASLPNPDVRHLLANEADADRPNDVAGRQADARRRLTIDRDPKLR